MKKTFFIPLLIGFLGGFKFPGNDRVACPKVAIVADVSKTVGTVGEVTIHGEMDSLLPVCEATGEQSLRMGMRLRLTGFRPRSKSQSILSFRPSYFLAIFNRDGVLLSRSDHEAELIFHPGEDVAVGFQQIEAPELSPDVAVYLGFNLDEGQRFTIAQERQERALGKGRGHRP